MDKRDAIVTLPSSRSTVTRSKEGALGLPSGDYRSDNLPYKSCLARALRRFSDAGWGVASKVRYTRTVGLRDWGGGR